MLSCDIQFLLGLLLYFIGPWFTMIKNDTNIVMQDKFSRFFTIEHETMMILALILVHVGKSSVKKASTDTAKHKKMLIFFGLAIVLIIAAIPWPFRDVIGMPWLRW